MRRTIALLLLTGAVGALRAEEQSSSPYATAADFAKYAMKLREQALLKVEQLMGFELAGELRRFR